VLSVFAHPTWVVTLTALVLALGTFAWRVSRARLLMKAGTAALEAGEKDKERRKAALEIVKALTSDEPWYLAFLQWRRSDDGQP
jgi:hypothetical protein